MPFNPRDLEMSAMAVAVDNAIRHPSDGAWTIEARQIIDRLRETLLYVVQDARGRVISWWLHTRPGNFPWRLAPLQVRRPRPANVEAIYRQRLLEAVRDATAHQWSWDAAVAVDRLVGALSFQISLAVSLAELQNEYQRGYDRMRRLNRRQRHNQGLPVVTARVPRPPRPHRPRREEVAAVDYPEVDVEAVVEIQLDSD